LGPQKGGYEMMRAITHYRVEYALAEGDRYELYCKSLDLILAERRIEEVIKARKPVSARIVKVTERELVVWGNDREDSPEDEIEQLRRNQ
jgi:hypothetical protein